MLHELINTTNYQFRVLRDLIYSVSSLYLQTAVLYPIIVELSSNFVISLIYIELQTFKSITSVIVNEVVGDAIS